MKVIDLQKTSMIFFNKIPKVPFLLTLFLFENSKRGIIK